MNNIIMLDLVGVVLNLLYSLKEYTVMMVVIGSIYSTLQCFFGYSTFKFWVGLQGFILFGITGILVGYLSFNEEMKLYLIMGLILGCLGAMLAMGLYKLGVFLQCFWTGSLIGILMGVVGKMEMEQIAATAIMFGIVIGTIGLIFIKPLIILTTGFSGGMTLGCIVSFASNLDIYTGVCAGLLLSILGVLYQSYSDEQPPKIMPSQDDNAPIQGT